MGILAPRHPAFEHFWVAPKVLAPHFVQDIGQIFFRIEAVRLARLDEAVDGSARLGSFWAVAEEPVLPADMKGRIALSAALFVMGMRPSLR